MKFLLALLASSNFSLVAATNYQPNNEQTINNKSLQDGNQDQSPMDYLNSIIGDYIIDEYGSENPWLETEHLNIAISIGNNPPIENDPILIQKSIDKDAKTIIHEESDSLDNKTDIQQEMSSSGFSESYTDSVSYSVSKGVGFEMMVPIEFASAKLNFNLNSTSVTTSSKQTTLTVPPQKVIVPAHQTRKVNYKVYEYTKIYNDILRFEASDSIKLHIEVKNDNWLNPLHFSTDDRLVDILSLSWSLDHHEVEDPNNPIYITDDGMLYMNIPTKIQVIKNDLNVIID